jgi:hypothetical protein
MAAIRSHLLMLVACALAAGCAPGQIGAAITATPQKPVISGFTADPTLVPAGGGQTVLSWQVSGADNVTIDQGIGDVTGTSRTVSITASTVFMLTASNAGGSVTAVAGVLVGADAPLISGFSASPMTVPSTGGMTTLSWNVLGADTLSIDQGVGTVTGTSRQVSVSADTTFTLSATNATGTTMKSVTVKLQSNVPAPTITSFKANPQTLPVGGGQTTLSWAVTGADSMSITPDVGTVTGTSKPVTLTQTTTYTLQATSAGGMATATTTVTVPPPTTNVHVDITPKNVGLTARGTQQFSATVTGSSNTAVVWSASGGTITSGGVYTAPATEGGYVIRATSVAEPTSSSTAAVSVSGGGTVLDPFYNEPYVMVMTPMPGATYFAPATVRIWAHAPYPGTGSVNGYAPEVDFFLGTTNIGNVTIGPNDNIDDYEVMKTGVTAGTYEVYVRTVTPEGSKESVHVPITVIDVPAHSGPILDLASDRVLSGSENLEILGTPSARALINSSNGSRIRSASGWSGHLTIRNADIIGLGSMDVGSVEVTVQGSNTLEISGSVFDRCGPLKLTANDQAPVIFQGNTVQPNTLTPVSAHADYDGSNPSVTVSGSSSAAKRFQGNSIGVSFVRLQTNHWLIGGDTDAQSNVLLGVRATLELNNSTDNTIRGNFIYHRYPYGWSQGHNLDFEGSTDPIVVEHNVFRSSSWMIQSMDGEFRYNLLVDNINEAFFRFTAPDTKIHHNILVNTSWQRVYYPSNGFNYLGDRTAIYNNTIDVGGTKLGWDNFPVIDSKGGVGVNVRNNVFTGFAYQTANNAILTPIAFGDYNCFFNPDTTKLTRYQDSGMGAHDCGGAAGSADPKFAQDRSVPFPFGDGDIWARRITVSQILAFYRGMYTPTTGSPLIDQGYPGDDTGTRNTDIGAVGAGNPHPDDKFGTFGN